MQKRIKRPIRHVFGHNRQIGRILDDPHQKDDIGVFQLV